MNIEIKKDGIIYLVPINKIIFCKSEGNYTCLVLIDKKFMVYQSLNETIKTLSDEYFFRCHNSYIVNLGEISEFDLTQNIITLTNKINLPVSNRRKKAFKCALREFTLKHK